MKKIYNRPTVNIVKLQLSHMIALSYTGDTKATTNEVLSRRGANDLWDDDDDE